MRLSQMEVDTIKQTVTRHFGAEAKVWLFGSRTDGDRRGGDIDLLVESPVNDVAALVRAETSFLVDLKQRIGDRKIDLLVDFPSRSVHPPVFRVAREQGIPL